MTNKTAAQIAREALAEEERPKRELAERQRKDRVAKEKRRLSRQKASAKKRLKGSLLEEWFPGVEWKFVETFSGPIRMAYENKCESVHMDVWQSGKDGDLLLRLGLINPTGRVVFLDPYPVQHPETQRGYQEQTRWLGWKVDSPADVARQLNSYIIRITPPAWA